MSANCLKARASSRTKQISTTQMSDQINQRNYLKTKKHIRNNRFRVTSYQPQSELKNYPRSISQRIFYQMDRNRPKARASSRAKQISTTQMSYQINQRNYLKPKTCQEQSIPRDVVLTIELIKELPTEYLLELFSLISPISFSLCLSKLRVSHWRIHISQKLCVRMKNCLLVFRRLSVIPFQ